jgi:DNA-binding transcriptional LysR family regulator
MDAADLRIFEATARLGSMNRAATELNTVQSNVTARIKLLEERLGARLLERHRRGVSLTAAGRRLLPFAIQIGQLLAEARQAVADGGLPRGPLLLGSLESTLALRLAPLLPSYAQAFPEVDLALRTGTSRELVTEVLERRIEGAFICGPVEHPLLAQESIFREELSLLAPPGMGALEDVLGRRDLRIVVLRAGCSYRQRLEEILARRGIVGWRILEFGTLEAVFGCVAGGLGLSLLPRGLIGPVWREGLVSAHRLPPGEAMVETLFVRRRDAFVSPAQSAFLAHLGTALRRARAAE